MTSGTDQRVRYAHTLPPSPLAKLAPRDGGGSEKPERKNRNHLRVVSTEAPSKATESLGRPVVIDQYRHLMAQIRGFHRIRGFGDASDPIDELLRPAYQKLVYLARQAAPSKRAFEAHLSQARGVKAI